MRELTVYYCRKCGRYGFYQLSKNAVCPSCQAPMTIFPMIYQRFMELDHNLRDQLIADQIAGNVTPRCSVVQRITEPESKSNSRADLAGIKTKYESLMMENQELRQKNAALEQTVDWMHDMIWELTQKLHETSHF